MKPKEIEEILGIADSTLSDWDKNPSRQRLMKLLRTIDKKEVLALLEQENFTPKYSPNTKRIKLRKKWFKQDLLYSREDNSVIDIDNLVAIYLKQPNQSDTNTLLYLFGAKRLNKVLEKIKEHIAPQDYNEAKEQIEYAISKESYKSKYPLPDIKTIFANPKERHLEILQERYSTKKILSMAQANNCSYNALFKLKKMVGEYR